MRSHVSVLTGLIAVVSTQALPYNPTSIIYTSKHADTPYIFLSNQLLSLNISSTLDPSHITFDSITPTLPFTSDDTTALIPSIAENGEIYVYTGSCSTSASSALWKFTPANNSAKANGTWAQQTTTTASDVTTASLPGADFLAQGFSFSTLVNANASKTNHYVFGGMCPNSSTLTTTTWQASANYSNHMLRFAPANSGKSYTLDVTAARGPPIAEAGMTVTGLTPTFSNGSGAMTQQQNFVLLGGHTQNAFINMSQVAVWSLPEESWSFVTVDSPSSRNPNTELAVKSAVTSVDSRSGHTAVLTEDGSKIIVFGGWVGDVSQAADPQLAVLNLGTGFGGSGDWVWSVPSNQPSGGGIYGHGAVVLPGGVMMVLGGNNISSSGSTKRAVSQGIQAMFFNTTSLIWGTNYTNPAYVASQRKSGGPSSSTKKIGLGVGLGLGLAVILGALLFYFCYSQHLKKKRREQREKDLNDLSRGASSFYHGNGEMASRRGSFPWSNNGWNRNNDGYDASNLDRDSAVVEYENLPAGVHNMGDGGDGGDIPSPPRQIPRKPLHSRARGSYQAASAFESGPHNRANSLGTAGPIHPIYEADENDGDLAGPVGIALGEPSSAAESKRYSDPFKDPSRQSTMLSMESESPTQSREREIQEWVSDWAAADLLMNSQARTHSNIGRVSPTRRAQLIAATTVSSVSGEEGDSGRTESNLSERTERSLAVSALSVSRSGSRSRSNSLRGFITGINPFTSNNVPMVPTSTVGGSTVLSTVFSSQPAPASSGSGSGRSAKSFNTAHTSFPILQAEGEYLLPRPDDAHSSSSHEHSPVRGVSSGGGGGVAFLEPPGSPSKSKLRGGLGGTGRSGWLGSLKRVFVSTPESTSTTPEQTFRSGDISPCHPDAGASGTHPRRAVSAGATLWRRKQGRGDWDDSLSIPAPLNFARSNTLTGGGDLGERSPGFSTGSRVEDGEEDEWDIERAVENRVVQVMFTVPRERLRVVNHDFDARRSEESEEIVLPPAKARVEESEDVEILSKGAEMPDVEAAEGKGLGDGAEGKGTEPEKERDPSPSPSKASSKSRGKVAEMVERMEGREA